MTQLRSNAAGHAAHAAADCRTESSVSDEARGIMREGRSASAHGGSCVVTALWPGDFGGRCSAADRSWALVTRAPLPTRSMPPVPWYADIQTHYLDTFAHGDFLHVNLGSILVTPGTRAQQKVDILLVSMRESVHSLSSPMSGWTHLL